MLFKILFILLAVGCGLWVWSVITKIRTDKHIELHEKVLGGTLSAVLIVVFICSVIGFKAWSETRYRFDTLYNRYNMNMILEEAGEPHYAMWFPDTTDGFVAVSVMLAKAEIAQYMEHYTTIKSMKESDTISHFAWMPKECLPIYVIPDPTATAYIDK